MNIRFFARASVVALAIILLAAPAMAADGNLARVAISGSAIDWQPLTQHGYTLTVNGPNGYHFQESFRSDGIASLSGLEDGEYAYEITAVVELQARNIVRDSDRGLEQVRAEIPSQSGYFRVFGGSIVNGAAQEEVVAAPAAPQGGLQNLPAADQVILDDLIVDGSICAGMDCVNGESFGFDTLRLKENNLRIKFQDTSNSASFPSVDWQITANDSSNGGANKFSIDNIDGGSTPFTIRSGAGNNALFVDDQGDIGLNTNAPVVELHIKDGDTPTIRLEQDGSSGFGSQTWDLAGNETNFFIRDVTNGSLLPLKILPSTPTNSLTLASGGVAIGSTNPDQQFHIDKNEDANTFGLVENVNAGTSAAAVWGARSNTAIVNVTAHGSGRTLTRFGEVLGDTAEILAPGNDLIIGTSSANKVIIGTNNNNVLEIASNGEIFHRGVSLHADYVFEETYDLPSIEENAEYMWSNKHLKAIGPARYTEDGREITTLGSDRQGIVEELEKAHIYIAQLYDQLQAKTNKVDQLTERLERLEAALAQ